GILFAAWALFACDEKPKESKTTSGDTKPAKVATSASAKSADPNAVTVLIAYGSEKKTWLEEGKAPLPATPPKTPSGQPIRIETKALGWGEAMNAVLDGSLKADVFSPASALYVSVLNDLWLGKPESNKKPLTKGGDALVLSPIVIAMWKPMAEALGWPKKKI